MQIRIEFFYFNQSFNLIRKIDELRMRTTSIFIFNNKIV